MENLRRQYNDNVQRFKADFADCSDFLLKEAETGGRKCFFAVMDGLVDSLQLGQMIMGPVLGAQVEARTPDEQFRQLMRTCVQSVELKEAETFEDAEWSLRLLREGEKRMDHNLSKTAAKFEQVPLECDGSDWSASIMVDFLDEDNAEMLADKELRRLYAAMSKLTERQMEVVQLYFYKGMTQQEIAEEIGIGRRSVGNCLEGALKKIRKNF